MTDTPDRFYAWPEIAELQDPGEEPGHDPLPAPEARTFGSSREALAYLREELHEELVAGVAPTSRAHLPHGHLRGVLHDTLAQEGMHCRWHVTPGGQLTATHRRLGAEEVPVAVRIIGTA